MWVVVAALPLDSVEPCIGGEHFASALWALVGYDRGGLEDGSDATRRRIEAFRNDSWP